MTAQVQARVALSSVPAEPAAVTAPGRILLLTQLYPPDVGGSAVLLHEGYSRVQGAELVVAADLKSRACEPTNPQRAVGLPIATTRWGFVHPSAVMHHLRLGWRLRRLARTDMVVHCARALPEGIAAWTARQLGGAPYVCWTHGEDLTTSLTSREQTLVTRRVHAGASAIIANSRNTKRLLEESGVEGSKIQVVYPGVDTDRFAPTVSGVRLRQKFTIGDGPLLLSVGRLQRRKGHDLAIAAVARLARTWPALRYLIVGNGDERGRLEDLSRSLGVTRHVVFAGEVPADDLPAYYAACDVFVMPNRVDGVDIEGFGIVFLEAASTGRPAIGGASGGVPEAVVDGQTGLLVGGTDSDELAAAIGRLISAPALARRLGEAGRARVERHFTWTVTAAGIARVQREVVGEGND
jgi:phosphatidylinositol alpha-1,6-mannosyltransferase